MSDFISCRLILHSMVILGFMLHHMLRVNISIAIVEMATKDNLNWNEEQKNDVLGFFFLTYGLTGIPGGRFSEIFGTKIVLGLSMLFSSIFTLMVPFASHLHLYCIIAVRMGLGLVMGVQWPSLPPMATKWVGPQDTAKFLSHTTASSLGAGLTLPLCGYLIAHWGWGSVFYVTGGITLVWSLFWFYLVYDSPQQHPRISEKEKEMLLKQIGPPLVVREKTPTPWVKILVSRPVWAILIANVCGCITFYFGLSQFPSYMKSVLHYSIQENGILSGLPYVVRYASSVIAAIFGDKLMKSGKLSTLATRRLFSTVAFGGICVAFLVQVFWGYDRVVSVIVFNSVFICIGFFTPGFFANCIDLSPVYSGTILGYGNTAGAFTGYILTKTVAVMTKENQDFEQWRGLFWILIGTNFITAILFFVLASGKLQDWNPKEAEPEMDKLKSNSE